MFDKLGAMGSKGAAAAKLVMLQNKIKKMKVVYEDKGIKVEVTGEGKLREIEIDGEKRKEVVEVVNEAISKAQKKAASEMQGAMGDLSKLFQG